MSREFIEDQNGTVARIVKIPYFECSFCGNTFDIDDPTVQTSANDCRERCPKDNTRLNRLSADVGVG